jgi:hypothetical protein
MLFAFILFNGFVCSLGHGLGTPGVGPDVHQRTGDAHQASPHLHDMSEMQASGRLSMGDHHGKQSLMDNCPFASILILLLTCLAALGWLRRQRRTSTLLPEPWEGPPLWLAFPALNPRGP